MGTFLFRWPYPANDVHVTGTFDDWGKSEQLNKVGDHWEKEVELPSADEKVLYKFVVDDQWIVDDAAPKQDDGHFNINNVLLPEQIKRKPAATKITDTLPGAFPETPAREPDSFSVDPIPASAGAGNPVSVPAGASLPDRKDVTSNTIGSTVTTSKEDYEKAGSEPFPGTAAGNDPVFSVTPVPASSGAGNPVSLPAGASLPDQKDVTSNTIDFTVTTSKDDYEKAGSAPFPGTSTGHDQTFSVNPIPATSGAGNPISLPAGAPVPGQKDITPNTIDSAVTTSKEDYEKAGSEPFPGTSIGQDPTFSVNPIPATSGAGNPISLPSGEKIPDQKDVTSNTIDSAVTTSKEDYEKAGSESFPGASTGQDQTFSVNPRCKKCEISSK